MMKIMIACAIAAVLGVAEAGYVSGKRCPTVTSIPYQSAMATRTLHRLLYIDSTTYSYLTLLQKATPTSKTPSTTCPNDGTYGFTAEQYAYYYQNSTGALAMNMLYYDSATGTEFFYDCIDQTKLAAILAYVAVEFGVALPQAVVNSVSKLLLFGHFDIFLVVSAATSLPAAVQSSMVTQVKTQFPQFTMNSMTGFNQTDC